MQASSDPDPEVVICNLDESIQHTSLYKTILITSQQAGILEDQKVESIIQNSKILLETENIHTKTCNKPPYISQIYGEIREGWYQEFLGYLKSFPPSKQAEYKLKFYNEVDLQLQDCFEQIYKLRERYGEYIICKDFKSSALNLRESLKLACISNSDLDLVRSEVMDLSLDWYIAIDRAVDAIARCQLYDITHEFSYSNLYTNMKQKYSMEKKESWAEWLYSYWKSSLKSIKQYFKDKATLMNSKNNDISPSDLLTFIAYVTCEKVLSIFNKEMDHQEEKTNLMKAKGFLVNAVKNIDFITKLINCQIRKCLLATTEEEKQTEKKELEIMISCLFNFENDATILDLYKTEELIQVIEKPISTFSQTKLLEISLVKSVYLNLKT